MSFRFLKFTNVVSFFSEYRWLKKINVQFSIELFLLFTILNFLNLFSKNSQYFAASFLFCGYFFFIFFVNCELCTLIRYQLSDVPHNMWQELWVTQ
jgi:hypothetical protein